MKKLALIVLLAVVASRVLADRDRGHHRPPAPRAVSLVEAGDAHFGPRPPEPPAPPSPPGVARAASWHGWGEDPTPAPPVPGKSGKDKRRPQPGKAARVAAPVVPSKVAPVWFPRTEAEEEALARADAEGRRVLLGPISVSTDRAQADLRKQVNHEIGQWLAADVPTTWTPPRRLVDRMIQGTYVRPEAWSPRPKGTATPATGADSLAGLEEFYTLYRAGQRLDFSEDRRADFVEAYRRDVASTRMRRSGAGIAVVLALLAATSFYVRADVATKGYYTNRLRLLAALGLGAAGAAAYRYLA